jgi:hypothetical protein
MSKNEALMDFSNIVLSYAVNATIHLGLTPDPANGQISRDLNRSKDLIDILDVLKTKTQGNLSDDEEKVLSETLSNLKMLYVKAVSPKEDAETKKSPKKDKKAKKSPKKDKKATKKD